MRPGARRLARDFKKINENSELSNISATLVKDDLYLWHMEIGFEDESVNKKLFEVGMACMLLEVMFPADYPISPPFVRLLRPCILGTYVSLHGGLCMEALSNSRWAPATDIETLFLNVKFLLAQRNFVIQGVGSPHYHANKAAQDFQRFMNIHKWN